MLKPTLKETYYGPTGTSFVKSSFREVPCSLSVGTAAATGLFETSIAFVVDCSFDRAKALRFALFENGNRPQAVIMVLGGLRA